ncbi:hypothetical protein [Yoonia maritima]|uniref:hypothetical protein n=1 Tax=Yoonia maritima TaxID=1435347 RepID=UPI00373541B7
MVKALGVFGLSLCACLLLALVVSSGLIKFVVAPTWLAENEQIIVATSCVFGLFFALIMWVLSRQVNYKGARFGYWMAAGYVLFGTMAVYSGVAVVYPMGHALLGGTQGRVLNLVVRDPWPSTKGCQRGVEIVGGALIAGRVCGIPDELRPFIHAGSGISIVGYGTELGVFHDDVLIEQDGLDFGLPAD